MKSDGFFDTTKSSFRRPRYRWEDIIKMDLKEMGWEEVDRVHLSEGRNWGWVL
jgi:hypothetical protein